MQLSGRLRLNWSRRDNFVVRPVTAASVPTDLHSHGLDEGAQRELHLAVIDTRSMGLGEDFAGADTTVRRRQPLTDTYKGLTAQLACSLMPSGAVLGTFTK